MVIDMIQIVNGQKVLFFGDNRIGKTRLLEAIHGRHSHYAGTIEYKGKASYFKKKEGSIMLGNISHVIPSETVWKNVTIPLPKISKRQKIKIFEILKSVNLDSKFGIKIEKLSFSEVKMLELIRAVIQFPHLILIDDLDIYFDEKTYLKAMDIIQYAVSSGSTVIATAKRKLDFFDQYYREQDRKIVKI